MHLADIDLFQRIVAHLGSRYLPSVTLGDDSNIFFFAVRRGYQTVISNLELALAEVVQATASSVITTLLNLVPLATRSVLPGTMCLSRVSRSGHLCAGCKGLGFVGAPLVFRPPKPALRQRSNRSMYVSSGSPTNHAFSTTYPIMVHSAEPPMNRRLTTGRLKAVPSAIRS